MLLATMFGSLFSEDNIGFSQNVGKSGSASEKEKKILVPPPPRPCTNMCGIKNQGATCYLNSLLQTLLYTPEFRNGLFCLTREELGWVEKGKEKATDKKLRVIPVELQKLFSQLLLADVEAVSTSDLTESFGWVDNEELQQHDVQELNRILFSAIEKSLVGTSGKDLISSLYRGTVVNQVECLECGHVSEREESFFDLTISVSGHDSLESSLKSTFLIPEKMIGSNRYHCGHCDHLVDANKGAKLKTLPPVLTLSLLRFSYDPMKGERYKDMSKFSFPTRLDLNPFCDCSGNESCENVYQLLSVVVHKGNAHGGHYHAYVRDVGSLGHWNLSSSQEEKKNHSIDGNQESTVLPENYVEEVKDRTYDDDDSLPLPAALLRDILRRDSCFAPSGTMPLVDLCAKLAEVSGGSTWRETFQPKFGHLSKFLATHPSLFYFNKVTRAVGLQPAGAKRYDMISGAPKNMNGSLGLAAGLLGEEEQMIGNLSMAEGPLVPPRVQSRGGSMDGKGVHRRKKRKKKKGRGGWKGKKTEERKEEEVIEDGGSSSEDEEEGCHWFDFDDASVTPIPMSALEAQYSGRESAYMLFYRKEGLGCGKNKKTLVPEHLANLVEEKNLELRNQREEYDRRLHEVFIRVLPSSAYVIRNGGIQKLSKNDICEEIRVSADKRWDISRLKKEIIKVCEETKGWEMEGRFLYTVQDTPCGLHLVDPLSAKSNPDTRLVKDVVKGDDFRIFAWNGSDIGGYPYHAGSENEPILLRILLPPVGGASHEVTRGFAKSLPLSHLRVAVAEMCQLNTLSFYLSYEPPMESIENSKNHRKVTRNTDSNTAAGKCPEDDQTNGVDDGNFTLYKPIRLSQMSNSLSLSALGMMSGGRILVDSKSISNASQEQPQKNTMVWVEDWTQAGGKFSISKTPNHCKDSSIRKDGEGIIHWGFEGRVVRMDVPLETTVEQLKNSAIKEFELPPNNYRLRKQEDEPVDCYGDSSANGKGSLRSPLQEHLVLSEANVQFGSKVVLEEGKPVGENEIWLTFSPPSCSGEGARELEIIMDKRCSIRELLKEMLKLAHLSGEEWHIRKTKWNGDSGQPLDDLNASICNESIEYGQHLILCEKSLPQRGFIRLHLYLCSLMKDSLELIHNCQDHSPQMNGGSKEMDNNYGEAEENHIHGKWVTQKLDKNLVMEIASYKLDNLGCLEIEQGSSLHELKRTIIALSPRVQSLCSSSPKRIRIRLFKKAENAAKSTGSETVRFSRVLKNYSVHRLARNPTHDKNMEQNGLNLASLQVHSGDIIGVQVLPVEEELGSDDVVLELCLRHANGKSYNPPVELVWNNSGCSSYPKASNCNNAIKSCEFNGTTPNNCSPSSSSASSDSPTESQSSNPLEDEDSLALGFIKAVSSILNVPEDGIVLAKYISTKRDWIIFPGTYKQILESIAPDKQTPVQSKKGILYSRKLARQFITNLTDGDVIVVKDVSSELESGIQINFSSSKETGSSCIHDINGEKMKNGLEGDNLMNFSLVKEPETSSRSNGEKIKNGLNIGPQLCIEWKETPKKFEKGIHIQVVDYS